MSNLDRVKVGGNELDRRISLVFNQAFRLVAVLFNDKCLEADGGVNNLHSVSLNARIAETPMSRTPFRRKISSRTFRASSRMRRANSGSFRPDAASSAAYSRSAMTSGANGVFSSMVFMLALSQSKARCQPEETAVSSAAWREAQPVACSGHRRTHELGHM